MKPLVLEVGQFSVVLEGLKFSTLVAVVIVAVVSNRAIMHQAWSRGRALPQVRDESVGEGRVQTRP